MDKQIERFQLQEALSDITAALTEPLAWRALALEIQQGYRDDIAQLDADIAALERALKP